MDDLALDAGPLVRDFTGELFTRLASAAPGNLVCSPYSAAVALTMAAAGARANTLAEILGVLNADDATALADGLGVLGQALSERAGEVPNGTAEPDRIEISSANSLWGQAGVRWEPDFLALLERALGLGLQEVDFQQRAEAARELINGWVGEQTRGRIPKLLPPDVIDETTRLMLVNAVYFKAPGSV